jgi:D-alanine-D-alanine ligase
MALKTALVYNQRPDAVQDNPSDFYALRNSDKTIIAVRNALRKSGAKVKLIEANDNVYQKLKNTHTDIVFNIAEGLSGESKISQIPAILEMLSIPYTGSSVLTMALALNKAKTKEVLRSNNIPTPDFQLFYDESDAIDTSLQFPLIVKPVAEDSSIGIRNNAVVKNQKELSERVSWIIHSYKQPAIVEELLTGKEFRVVVVGNNQITALPIIAFNFDGLPKGVNKIYSYEAKWVWNKPLNILSCPAKIPEALEKNIKDTAKKAYYAIGCRDWAGIDIRLDANGRAHVLEINPLTGILPDSSKNSCFLKAAATAGLSYEEMVNIPLIYALRRYGLYDRHKSEFLDDLAKKLALIN